MEKISQFILLKNNGTPDHTMVGWSAGKARLKKEAAYDREDVGIVPPKGMLIVDADTPEAVQTVERVNKAFKLTVFSYNTTRGKHFVYKMPDGKFFDNISSSVGTSVFQTEDEGSKIDVKAGGRNGKNGYVAIKRRGQWRVMPDDILKAFEDAPECPMVLLMPFKYKIYFNDYREGQRDNTIFRWVAKLRGAGLEKSKFTKFVVEVAFLKGDDKSVEEIVQWVNQKWDSSSTMGPLKDFTHESVGDVDITIEGEGTINADPIESILTYQKDTTLITGCTDYGKLAKFVIDEMKLIRSLNDNQIWGFVLGKVRPIPGSELNLSIRRFLIGRFENIKPQIMNDIVKFIEAAIPIKEFSKNNFLVKFNNTMLDTLNNETVSLGENEMIQNSIPHNLISRDALKTTHLEEYLFVKELFKGWTKDNEDLTKQIFERVGLTMIKYTGLEKIFFLLGIGSNGKSMFLRMLKNSIGDDNVSSEDLKHFSDTNGFSQSNTYGKLANINADISANFIEDPSMFKKLASGDTISAAYKGVDKFQFEPYAKMWFGTNEVPHLKDSGDSEGVNRRIEIIPFLALFDKTKMTQKEIIKIQSKMSDEKTIEVFIRMAIDHLHEALKGQFTLSKVSADALQQLIKEQNHMFYFVEECGIKDNEITTDAYKRYKDWTMQYGYKVYGQTIFIKKYRNVARRKGINIATITDKTDKTKSRHRIIILDDMDE